MASNNDFERRLASVEEHAGVARTEAAAALVLAKCADRDVSHFQEKLTAQTRIIESIRQTQFDYGRILGDNTKRLDSHTTLLNSHTELLNSHTKRLDSHTELLDNHTERLERLETKVDQGFALMDENFAKVEEQFAIQAAGQAQITALINRIIDNDK